MKKIILFISLGFASLASCQTQSNFNTFGKYYKIGDYNIQAPFAEQPHVSPKQENFALTLTSYQYAYPKPGDDLNRGYGVDIIELKNDTMFHSLSTKIDFCEGMLKVVFETMLKGKTIKEENDNYRGNYCKRLKIQANIVNVGEVYIYSIFVPCNKLILRIFAITPIENDGNKRINDFFDSVKYE